MGKTIIVPEEAHEIAREEAFKARKPIGKFVADAIKEKSERDKIKPAEPAQPAKPAG